MSAPYVIDIRWQQNGKTAHAHFAIEAGVTALIGPSGAGKTTVARIITGLQQPEAGSIRGPERTIVDTAVRHSLPTAKRRIGYVTQEPALFPTMSVRDNILIGSKLSGEEFDTLCADVGVQTLLTRNPKTLSGGETRRVSITRALAAKPQLLILDEPMNGLDPKRRKELLSLIRRLSHKTRTPTLFITHQIEEMLIAADHAVLMGDGKTLRTGTIEDVIADPQTGTLLGIDDAGSIVTATVTERVDGLLKAMIGEQEIYLADDDEPIGSKLRLRILARDISIAKNKVINISIINQLPAIVNSIDSAGNDRILWLKLEKSNTFMTARITEKSFIALGISNDKKVHALVKAVAVKEMMAG